MTPPPPNDPRTAGAMSPAPVTVTLPADSVTDPDVFPAYRDVGPTWSPAQ
jgi:hypothetical protein